MYYCRNCKKIFKEVLFEICECGRKLNSTSDDYLDAYLHKGYTLHLCERQEKKDIEFIKQDILNNMGVKSYAELFDSQRIITQCIQEENNKAEERKEKEKEIWANKEQRKKLQQERRKKMFDKADDFVNLENTEQVETVFSVETFLASLGLQKKKDET